MHPKSQQHAAIASAYDQLADRWRDGTFNPDDGVEQFRRALRFLGEGEGWALNVGCGCNTRFNALLRARELRLEGVDISQRMIAMARRADPAVLLQHADVCAWRAQRGYRFIAAWDSIWHVDLGQQRALMLKLMQALEPGGVFLFTAGGLDAEGSHVDSSMGVEVSYSTLGVPGLLAVVKQAGCVCRHLEFDQYPLKHLVVIVQRSAAIAA
ncbi:class I SAM-dependent DNA methyltransferase [Comamonas antarctica]|uniref:Class I SAM-dependent methyltransferase n=2 Tax=Comamonas antarctica TaxID=2743470 RepID=A0A6N1XBR5_9BURK|nr:class I SAM-dependent methyltransferase [Comamonas antarctica]QKV55522.1 class I SAM-dependent methyltransferase [Comamonas antarctica]